jgi:hypothetical protein
VVTAAHCIHTNIGQPETVILGQVRSATLHSVQFNPRQLDISAPVTAPGVEVMVESITVHPGFKVVNVML